MKRLFVWIGLMLYAVMYTCYITHFKSGGAVKLSFHMIRGGFFWMLYWIRMNHVPVERTIRLSPSLRSFSSLNEPFHLSLGTDSPSFNFQAKITHWMSASASFKTGFSNNGNSRCSSCVIEISFFFRIGNMVYKEKKKQIISSRSPYKERKKGKKKWRRTKPQLRTKGTRKSDNAPTGIVMFQKTKSEKEKREER